METDQRGVEELSSEECLELLAGQQVGRLAVAIRDHPDIFPVNFIVDRGCVVFRTAEGTKLAAAVLGRGVAFEVDGVDESRGEAWSVIVKGHAVELQGMEELFEATGLPLFPWHSSPKHRFVKIEPVRLTGRRFHIVGPDAWTDPVRVEA
jgi:nitroimidazol reductase NimA-like FMN-containing flavoprotein (pyridoxamine 5'-phosphate oxidase superfamily)